MVYAGTMQFPMVSMDFLNLLYLPLMVLTGVDARKNWSSIWDAQLTWRDCQALQKIVLFLLIPVVVLGHELGHVAAIKLFGGQVAEFHYALFWGYVVPRGTFTAPQLVWAFLAGSLVQVMIGIAAIASAIFVRSPPVVALLIYLGLWSIGGTVVVYALLSLTGLYGDWVAIYTAPVPGLVIGIAIVHVALIAFVVWCLYATTARVWFTGKTHPRWIEEQVSLWAAVTNQPSAGNWINLAWSYYNVNINGKSLECLRHAKELDPHSAEIEMLEGALAYRKGDLATAMRCFRALAARDDVSPQLRSRALLALGGCQVKSRQLEKALEIYDKAIEADPTVADAYFFKAMLLADAKRYDEAAAVLGTALRLNWVDSTLADAAIAELKAITKRVVKK